jgi:hypothetical protein
MKNELLRVEFHCHTNHSHDSLTTPASLVAACRRKKIDRVVITDHNTIKGAQEAKVIAPEMVIIGEEIMTEAGELLAAFVRENIPPDLPPLEAIERLKAQDAFISVSHPFDRFRSGGWEVERLIEILPLVDAIEVFNSRCILPGFNKQARALADRLDLAGTVGSDAHASYELGRSILKIKPFQNAEELRKAIRTAIPIVKWSPPWFHLSSRYAALRK